MRHEHTTIHPEKEIAEQNMNISKIQLGEPMSLLALFVRVDRGVTFKSMDDSKHHQKLTPA